MSTLRWSPEQLAEYKAKHGKGIVAQPEHIAGQKAENRRVERALAAAVAPKRSPLEIRLEQQMREAGVPTPETEWYGIPDRNFRFDFAWPSLRIAVEVQGGAHRVKGRFNADIEKRALALLSGWRVLEVNGAAIKSGQAIEWVIQLLDTPSTHTEEF